MNQKIIFALFILFFSSCVSMKKFKTSQADLQTCSESLADTDSKLKTCTDDKQTALARLDDANLHLEKLQTDSTITHLQLEKEIAANAELQAANESLLKQKNELLENSSAQSKELNTKLQQKQAELEQKQSELENKELSNAALTTELKMRMLKVKELESVLNAKDSVMNNLKKKISDALEGFDKSDLTVERKNGKVYVSMAEKLLFKSGSTEVDTKGKDALKKLAEVLAKNPDINIVVEGHTDNAKFSHETYPRDNWDLSVLRATTIVKILAENKITPSRISAAGRSEYVPLEDNSTKAGKSRNRRTEIILTPKLDELIKIIDGQ